MSATSPVDVSHYSYLVSWSTDDGEFVGTCVEFPSLSWLEETPTAALTGIQKVIAETVDDLVRSNEPIPTPLSDRTYSGKFNLRVGESLHRQLVREASVAGLSLNQYVVRCLIRSLDVA